MTNPWHKGMDMGVDMTSAIVFCVDGGGDGEVW